MLLAANSGLDINAPWLVITASVIIILSYICNLIARKTNIPSVLLLILMGILIKEGLDSLEIPWLNAEDEGLVLELLGTVGLIFIVLEAALDLKLTREKWPIIWKSFVTALVALLLSSGAIALIIHQFILPEATAAEGAAAWVKCFTYAIPLSIMSSAIIIPSVAGLAEDPKEFMIYESTFSDILGIMFFYLLLGNADSTTGGAVAGSVVTNIALTLLLSIVVSYALSWLVQRITGNLKLFLTIACLLLLYQIGKLAHLSPLVLILVFGLMLNNPKLFWRSKLQRFVDFDRIHSVTHEFHLLTLETAFVVRTFFFVIFGITIVLSSLLDIGIVFYSLMMVVALYVVRLLALLVFNKKDLFPLLYVAPRGLITILLYFQIQGSYSEQFIPEFNQGILLFVIIATSVVMTISLIQNGLASGRVPKEGEMLPENGEALPANDVDVHLTEKDSESDASSAE